MTAVRKIRRAPRSGTGQARSTVAWLVLGFTGACSAEDASRDAPDAGGGDACTAAGGCALDERERVDSRSDARAPDAEEEGNGAAREPALPRQGSSTCLQGAAPYDRPGPYAVETMPGPPDYTIYLPSPLEQECRHPFVAWGNGFLISGTTPHDAMHRRLASWGFVVSVPHASGVGTGRHHERGLDWLLEQNADAASPLFGKLGERAGVAGHSQGGQGANNAAHHPSVAAVACIQCITEGCTPTNPNSCGPPVPTDRPRLCLTADIDTALEPTLMTYEASTGPALLGVWGPGANHLTPLWTGIESPAGQQYLRLYAAWFRCFLAGDDAACALFQGNESCSVCSDPGWSRITAKNFD